MKKFFKIVLLIVAVLILVVVAFYGYYGGFSHISSKVEIAGGETVVYENLTGDYSQAGQIADKIYYSLLNDYHIETTKGFGLYYDNPMHVDKDKLRSEVGCMLDNQIDSLQQLGISQKFHIKTLPVQNSVIMEFPYNGSISIFIGIFRVYPALEKYLSEHNLNASGPVMEIYDVPNEKIYYRQAVQ